jgi:hypothetical protein
MDQFYVVIHGYDDRMAEYVKNVLGHGGCNTFPDLSGKCKCGVLLASNMQECTCPACGEKVNLLQYESFSSWCGRTGGGIESGCKFIALAASHRI